MKAILQLQFKSLLYQSFRLKVPVMDIHFILFSTDAAVRSSGFADHDRGVGVNIGRLILIASPALTSILPFPEYLSTSSVPRSYACVILQVGVTCTELLNSSFIVKVPQKSLCLFLANQFTF